MRKPLICLTPLIAATLFTFAQDKPIKFGVKAGLNLPTISVSGDEVDDEYSDYLTSSTSFYVGANVDFAIGEVISLQPGLTLSGKGYQLKADEDGASYTDKTNVMYLEIPVNAVASFAAGPGKVFAGVGPYYGIALSGKNKWEITEGGEIESDEEDIEFGSEEEQMKRGDFGVNLLAGYQLTNGLNLHLGYGLGLSNLSNTDGVSIKNRVFSVGIGFSF